MLNILIFGPPGCGKGTQSEFLVNQYNLKHLSTGDIFRENIKNKTNLGIEAKNYMDKGQLVPDFITIDMLGKKMQNESEFEGFLFDGFPRTKNQAKSLDSFLLKMNQDITMMISIEVPQDELVKRLLKRGKISNRADDQNEEIIFNRIKIYKENTEILKEYYYKQNKFFTVNGVSTIDDVKRKIFSLIDNFQK